MTFVRKLMMAGATMLAGFALKKIMGQVQAQADKMAEKIKQQAEEKRDPREFKRLKQDPVTGVYYAEE
jgi:ABC-type transporter MlaC component